MKPSQIKTECEQVYQNIKLQEDKLERLQSICKHPNTFEGNYYYRIAQYTKGLICSDCRKIIKSYWPEIMPENKTT